MFDIKKYFLLSACKDFYFKIFTENFKIKIFVIFILKNLIKTFFIKFFKLSKKSFYNFMLYYLSRQHKISAVW